MAQEKRQNEGLAWLRGKPLGSCSEECNNISAFVGSNPALADVLGLGKPSDLGFSNAASGYKMRSHGRSQPGCQNGIPDKWDKFTQS